MGVIGYQGIGIPGVVSIFHAVLFGNAHPKIMTYITTNIWANEDEEFINFLEEEGFDSFVIFFDNRKRCISIKFDDDHDAVQYKLMDLERKYLTVTRNVNFIPEWKFDDTWNDELEKKLGL